MGKDGTPVSVQQCRNMYEACSETDDIEVFTVMDKNGQVTHIPYQRYCPCWDKSTMGLDGAGLNIGTVFPYRRWVRRNYMNGRWVTVASGTFLELFGDRVIKIRDTRQLSPNYQYSPDITEPEILQLSLELMELSSEEIEANLTGRASRRSRTGRYIKTDAQD